MDDKELKVGTNLVMLIKGIEVVTLSEDNMMFYYKGLEYNFNDLATLVEWYVEAVE